VSRAPRLWAVVGATGTGKTGLSLAIAQALAARGTAAEIVNADAMQLYRGMDIGTAKLREDERRGVPHHLFDALEVTDEAAVAWYQDAARDVVRRIHDRGADAVLVGGSGLYVSSVVFDFAFPPRDAAVRAELEAELDRLGPGMLFARLAEQDAATAARVDPQNGRRIVRALEVLAQGQDTHGAVLPDEPVSWLGATTIVGTHIERAELVPMLDARVEGMWRDGLVEEAAALRERGLEDGVTARRAIGYAQALGQLRGELTESEAIAQTQTLTRRYARRQVSWFKRYRDVAWVDSRTVDAAALVDETPTGGTDASDPISRDS